MHRKRLGLLLATLCLAGVSLLAGANGAAGGAQRSQAKPIKIGVLRDVSGLVLFSSKQAVAGLTTTSTAMNKGNFFWMQGVVKDRRPGILGRPIEFVYFDTQANPNLALLGAQNLASQHVAAIVGDHHFSGRDPGASRLSASESALLVSVGVCRSDRPAAERRLRVHHGTHLRYAGGPVGGGTQEDESDGCGHHSRRQLGTAQT